MTDPADPPAADGEATTPPSEEEPRAAVFEVPAGSLASLLTPPPRCEQPPAQMPPTRIIYAEDLAPDHVIVVGPRRCTHGEHTHGIIEAVVLEVRQRGELIAARVLDNDGDQSGIQFGTLDFVRILERV